MIIADLHVHFHDRFNQTLFFNSIKKNFIELSRSEKQDHTQNIICLTESAGTSYFNELKKLGSAYDSIECWSVNDTISHNTLVMEHDSGYQIILFAGRQIVTEENLEVLAIGMVEEALEQKPLNEVIQTVISSGYIPIVPWGFGKWSGNRGNIIEKLVECNDHSPLFLGDNGNRPQIISQSSIFQKAKQKKIFNLQGTDPLPFSNEEKRVGSFGVIIDSNLETDNLFDGFLNLLNDDSLNIRSYGKLESLIKFVKHQIGMQIIKRLRKK